VKITKITYIFLTDIFLDFLKLFNNITRMQFMKCWVFNGKILTE